MKGTALVQNLEQIRAKHALEKAEGLSRAAVNKIPALILTNGLLATAAFCNAESSGETRVDMKKALEATIEHLAKCGILAPQTRSIEEMIYQLSNRSSQDLQRATTEALAFISYLKRFASKD